MFYRLWGGEAREVVREIADGGAVLARHALEDVVGGENAQLAGFAEVGNASFLVAHAQIHESAVVVGFSEVGLNLNGFGVASDSLGVVLDDYVGVTLVE